MGFALLANQARLVHADEGVSLAKDTVEAVKRRVRAGKAPEVELTRAEAELATTRLARDDVTHELFIAYHRRKFASSGYCRRELSSG